MISVDAHLEQVLALVSPLPAVDVRLLDAMGLVLAEDVVAPHDLPAFRNAAMDGYALIASDLAEGRATLRVIDDIAAGDVPSGAVRPGFASRIMTGALMPEGADVVVPVERTDGGVDEVRIEADVRAGDHIRLAGEDLAAGSVALARGSVIDERAIGLLAACGCATVRVHRRPRITIMSTGSELVPAGMPLAPAQIPDANGPMLVAAARAAGAEVTFIGPVHDDASTFQAAMTQAVQDSDCIVTSGGVSMGAYDTVKQELAGGVTFTKVAMNPGMPQGCGTVQGRPIITLPGNPVSSFVSFELFVRPAIRRLQGQATLFRPVIMATLTEPMTSPHGKRQFARGNIGDDGTVRPMTGQASHLVRGLAGANCLIMVPEQVTEVPAGSDVQVIDLRRW